MDRLEFFLGPNFKSKISIVIGAIVATIVIAGVLVNPILVFDVFLLLVAWLCIAVLVNWLVLILLNANED